MRAWGAQAVVGTLLSYYTGIRLWGKKNSSYLHFFGLCTTFVAELHKGHHHGQSQASHQNVKDPCHITEGQGTCLLLWTQHRVRHTPVQRCYTTEVLHQGGTPPEALPPEVFHRRPPPERLYWKGASPVSSTQRTCNTHRQNNRQRTQTVCENKLKINVKLFYF